MAHIRQMGAIARLLLSLACILAANMLVSLYVWVRYLSFDLAFGSLIIDIAFSSILWFDGIWIAIVALPLVVQRNWGMVPLAALHASVMGYLIWSYDNRGAVVFPPRQVTDYWRIGLLHACAAGVYVLLLRRRARLKPDRGDEVLSLFPTGPR